MLSEMRQMGEGCDKNALNEREKCVASVSSAFIKYPLFHLDLD